MSRLSKIVTAANWRYAVGEVVLIFLGITLALYANSWYENRENRIEEAALLKQVSGSLSNDIDALQSRSRAIAAKLESLTALQKHIEANETYNSDLDKAFSEIMIGGAARMSTAAFETLTFRGIDIVSDPTLRNLLVDYYDTERGRLQRRNDLDSRDAWALEPYFKKNFLWDSDDLSVKPLDYTALVSDPEFLNILAIRIWTHKGLARSEHERIAQKAMTLKKAIDAHLQEI